MQTDVVKFRELLTRLEQTNERDLHLEADVIGALFGQSVPLEVRRLSFAPLGSVDDAISPVKRMESPGDWCLHMRMSIHGNHADGTPSYSVAAWPTWEENSGCHLPALIVAAMLRGMIWKVA